MTLQSLTITPNKTTNQMKRIALLSFFLLLFLHAGAQISLTGTTAESPIALQADETYQFPTGMFENAYFTYTATGDGLLTMEVSESLHLFVSESANGIYDQMTKAGNLYFKGIKKGEQLWMYSDVTWGKEITMKVEFKEGISYLPIDTTSVSPAPGSKYHTAKNEGAISIEFNQPIAPEGVVATLKTEDGTEVRITDYRTSTNFATQGSIYSLYISDTYKELQEQGKLQAGETFTIEISQVASTDNAENVMEGVLSIPYTASAPATRLVEASITDKIKSFYLPGGEDGLISLTFTGEVSCTSPSATLYYGSKEADATWVEIPVPYTVDGNVITLNLQGINLSSAVLGEYTNVGISLKDIRDTEGNHIESNDVGNIGTVTLNYTVEQVVVNIYHEFTPGTGSTIDEAQEVEIWIGDGSNLQFEGAELKFTQEGDSTIVKLKKEELRIMADPAFPTDLLVYVPVSGYAFDKGEVTLSLTGTLAADGSSPTITCTYLSDGRSSAISDGPTYQEREEVTLYDLKGNVIRSTTTGKDMMQGLPEGIYLIKGKKIVNF